MRLYFLFLAAPDGVSQLRQLRTGPITMRMVVLLASALALLLAVHDEWRSNGGDFPECGESVTIAFDAEHRVSIQLGISPGVLETN